MSEKKSRVQTLKIFLIWTNVTVGILGLGCIVAAGSLVAYDRMYEGKYFPGVRVLGTRLDGLTKDEARKAVQDAVDAAMAKGLHFNYRGRDVTLDAMAVSTDPDSSRDLVRFDYNQALDKAFELGHGSGWQMNIAEQLRLRVYPMDTRAIVTIDRPAITEALKFNLKDDLKDFKNATLTINASSSHPEVTIVSEQEGRTLVVEPALDELQKQAEKLDFKPINLSDQALKPTVTASDLEPAMSQVFGYLNRPTITFIHEKKTFAVTTSTLASWITVTGTKDRIGLTIDPSKFAASLPNVAPGIEKENKKGTLVFKDEKVQSFEPGTEGVAFDAPAMLDKILSEWPTTSTFPILTKILPATLAGEDPEKLGIRDLLGVGYSKFSGSPNNRRKNIARGTEIMNGQIIQPDEVFSVSETVEPIDAAHGWFPEMVIKGNETKAEYGGGLCQIGTTVFRAAMKSGLPIIERQNHSYRVGYYEPAGTDATIYGPHPDLRFKNDTGHPIYINAYGVGDELFYEFWGTSDGRKGEIGQSHIYNLVPPPPKKLIETLDLEPGKKKRIETAHTGADADFTYSVTFASGEKKEQVFRSHYRPWQEVWLVGVEKLSATSTANGE
ncbi:VanW family protein [Candidatus Uhrbacteria bacterium]|nr:VanW family protein [Candidatus Uhrbacteria bacterium]